MTRIDHSFSIDKPAAEAQAMFVRDIAPELARDRDFEVVRERPGELIFSDGVPADSGQLEQDLEEPMEDRRDPVAEVSAPGWRFNAFLGPDNLAGVLPRHICVEFTDDGAGTRVRVHGHVERDVCHALEELGTPQHWPETADLPHD
jgi:hypothetical protein